MATGADLVRVELSDKGGRYVWAGTTPHPGLDCSGLNYWAMGQLGIPGAHAHRTAQALHDWCQGAGRLIPVAQARNVVGAWGFVGTPNDIHHVATSLGNGSTIEAANEKDGVGVFGWGNRFNYAGLCPSLTFGNAPAAPAPAAQPAAPAPIDYAALRRFAAGTLAGQMGALPTPMENSTLAGPNVKVLQQAMNLIFPDAHIPENSAYDGPTAFCVSAFQQSMNKLKVGAITDAFPGVFSNATKFWVIVSLDNIAKG